MPVIKHSGGIAVLSVLGVLTLAFGMANGQQHSGAGHALSADGDARQLVALPPPMAGHMLANMRDHLQALHEIHDALASNDTDGAARIAEQRLGMTSLASHGAEHMAPMMPAQMRGIGASMHAAASRFAVVVKDAGVTGELRPALAALGVVSGACVSCHSAFRIR